jgi:hypothetical protein
MNIALHPCEQKLLELELSIIKPLLDVTLRLIASVIQKNRQMEMSNLVGEQVTLHINGNASHISGHLSTPEGLSIYLDVLNAPSTNTDHSQRSEEMDKQSIIEKARRAVVYKDMLKEIKDFKMDDYCGVTPMLLGTLPETQTKEIDMFRDQYNNTFDIPTPTYNKCVAKSTQANIDLQVNMPQAQDPTDKARNRLLDRANMASYEKRDELRKAFNLIPDDEPVTIKDFVQRVKDGKFVTDLTEKEQAERKFYCLDRMLEEIEWRDPARVEDQEGFDAANVLLTKALNDVSDEIIVKTPEAGLESLRAFQAKTFH